MKEREEFTSDLPDEVKEALQIANQIQEAKKKDESEQQAFSPNQTTEENPNRIEEEPKNAAFMPSWTEEKDRNTIIEEDAKTENIEEKGNSEIGGASDSNCIEHGQEPKKYTGRPDMEEIVRDSKEVVFNNQEENSETAVKDAKEEVFKSQEENVETEAPSHQTEDSNEEILAEPTENENMEAPSVSDESKSVTDKEQKSTPKKQKHSKTERREKTLTPMESFQKGLYLSISGIWNVIRCVLTGMYRTFKFVLNMITIFIIVAVLGGCILFTRYHALYTNIRQTEYDRIANLSTDTFSNLNSTRVYDSKGKLLAELTSADYEYVEINSVSRYIQEGYIAVEDKNFKEHFGFDITGIARAGVALVKNSGAITQGGSTITQQVVKNTLLTSEQTYVRKCAEILLAMDMEKKFTKAQIMEFYVNSNFYGNQCYGVEAACQYYFGKSALDVNISEAAMIVGMSNSPSKYNPVANYDLSIEKRNNVLEKMYINGVITNEEKEEAIADPLLVVEKRTEALNENYQVSYAIYSAVITLMEKDGFEFEYSFKDKESYDKYREKYSEAYSAKSELVRSGGYDIYTSLDSKQQKKLQKSVDDILKGFSEKQDDGRYAVQGAAVCVNNQTGYVTAIVGGRGKNDQYNRAYLAKRQPGSTIKPLIDYAPAFETGDYFPSKIMVDQPIENGPKNSGGSYRGRISMREAIARSINTIAYQTLQGIGVNTGLSYLDNMRFNSLTYVDNNNLTVSIGGFTNGVRVVDMAKGYSTLAAGGTYIERTCIKKIEQQGEGIIYTDTKTSHPVYLEDTAWLMTNCLRGTMELPYGTGHGCTLQGQICAGKTGTTNESKDGWFCGYTTRYTTAVWVGRDDNKSIAGMYGATYAGKIWQAYMNDIHTGLDKEDFTKPETVKKKYVDSNGIPTNSKTGKQDYFSAYAENKRSLLEQEREEKKAIKNAEKLVTDFENFYIEKAEDCYVVDTKYQEAINSVVCITDTDIRIKLSTRVADKYSALQEELKNWESVMAAYEIEQARKKQAEQDAAAKAAQKAKVEKEKSLAITRFRNALNAVKETTDWVTEYTYEMLDLASTYLTQCAAYSEYDTLLEEYNAEKQRIASLAAKNAADTQVEQQNETAEASAKANRIERDRQRVEKEKEEAANRIIPSRKPTVTITPAPTDSTEPTETIEPQ